MAAKETRSCFVTDATLPSAIVAAAKAKVAAKESRSCSVTGATQPFAIVAVENIRPPGPLTT